MNILLPGKCQRNIPLQLTRFLVFHSLTKIHADLCECCAKPKEKCKQADQYHPCGDSKKAPSNPFSLLKFGCTVDHEYPSGIRTHDSQYDNGASDREGKTATSGPRVPRLIDDTLVEAIELRKAVQVYIRPAAFDDLTNVTSDRKWLICYLQRGMHGSRHQWANSRS